MFADAYKRLADKLKLTVPVLAKGGVRVEDGANSKLMISDITPLEDAQPKLPNHLRIKIPIEGVSPAMIDELHTICLERKGAARVLFDLERKRRLHRGDGGGRL